MNKITFIHIQILAAYFFFLLTGKFCFWYDILYYLFIYLFYLKMNLNDLMK